MTIDILNLPWTTLDPDTKDDFLERYFNDITKEDMECFVYNIFRKVARELRVPYCSIRDKLMDENEPFFMALKNEYEEFESYETYDDSKVLTGLLYLINVPDTSCFKNQTLDKSEEDLPNILNMPWTALDQDTRAEFFEEYFDSINETNLSAFVYNIFRKVARDLKVPYDDIKEILIDENTPFFTLFASKFDSFDSLDIDDEDDEITLRGLLSLINIPDTSKI